MTEREKDDLFFVCTLIEHIGRATKNRRGDVVSAMGPDEIRHQLSHASVNHCLPLAQVAEEVCARCSIQTGDFDTVSTCRYQLPTETAMGRLYQQLICDVREESTPLECAILQVFSSFLCDEICNFNSSLYYSGSDYLKWCYLEGKLLA